MLRNENYKKNNDDMKKEIKNLKIATFHQKFYFTNKTMLSYCLKSRKNTKGRNAKFVKTKKERIIPLPNNAQFVIVKSRNL